MTVLLILDIDNELKGPLRTTIELTVKSKLGLDQRR